LNLAHYEGKTTENIVKLNLITSNAITSFCTRKVYPPKKQSLKC